MLVHIGDPPPTNQAASLESQMIPTIQYVPGRALRREERARARRAMQKAEAERVGEAVDDGDGDRDDDGDGRPVPITWEDGVPMLRGKPMFAPLTKPRPGYTFINANCECWRRQFSNLFCTNCTPVARREVSIAEAVRT